MGVISLNIKTSTIMKEADEVWSRSNYLSAPPPPTHTVNLQLQGSNSVVVSHCCDGMSMVSSNSVAQWWLPILLSVLFGFLI